MNFFAYLQEMGNASNALIINEVEGQIQMHDVHVIQKGINQCTHLNSRSHYISRLEMAFGNICDEALNVSNYMLTGFPYLVATMRLYAPN